MSHVQDQQQLQEQQQNDTGNVMRGGYYDIFAQDASNGGNSDCEQPSFRKRESFPETSKLVGLIRDVGSSIKERTLRRKQSQDSSIDNTTGSNTMLTNNPNSSSATTPVISVMEAPPTNERPSSYRRQRTSSIKGKSHQTEEELGTPVNIYLEHRVHLEQDKRARTDLDTRLLGETLYVPQSPTSSEPLLSLSLTPSTPSSATLSPPSPLTPTDSIDSWWAYNDLLGSCGSAVVGVHPTSGFAGGDWRRVVL